ncbi:MAG TPA: class I SAM-dependent methyltransferase [Candidatus Saccharimonadales bacterium]|nr:class I SAM-dependent methyltransferase [Candidatus Saccharimonadales bacterium]
MTNYDLFAKFYDAAMGDPTTKTVRLKTLIRKHQPQAKTLLELACGTGSILKELCNDYTVEGLELSPKMLEIAARKVPQATLHLGDMSNFNLGKQFDVVICVFDSINHLEAFEGWQAVFKHASDHLTKGGLFIFDFNTIGRLERLMQSPPAISRLGDDYLFMTITKTPSGASNWDIKVFEALGGSKFELHEENIIEASYPLEQVKKAAGEYFDLLEIIDHFDGEPSDESDRVWVVGRKK